MPGPVQSHHRPARVGSCPGRRDHPLGHPRTRPASARRRRPGRARGGPDPFRRAAGPRRPPLPGSPRCQASRGGACRPGRQPTWRSAGSRVVPAAVGPRLPPRAPRCAARPPDDQWTQGGQAAGPTAGPGSSAGSPAGGVRGRVHVLGRVLRARLPHRLPVPVRAGSPGRPPPGPRARHGVGAARPREALLATARPATSGHATAPPVISGGAVVVWPTVSVRRRPRGPPASGTGRRRDRRCCASASRRSR